MGTSWHEDSEATIVRTDGVLGGKPRLEGHRISVLDVTELLQSGYSIRDCADHLDISPDAVRTAARYYRRHRDDMVALEARRRRKHDELRGTTKSR